MEKLRKLSDDELVKRFIAGNKLAITVLVERHKTRIFSYIILVVKQNELAEDIFQDAFIKVIKSLHQGKYIENGRFCSWVMRIAHNLIIDFYRKDKQLNAISNDDYEVDLFNSTKLADKTFEDNIINTQVSKDIRKLIKELPFDQKEVIILRHYCDFSFKEIADHTNVSINTALGRMRYALINLRKLVEEKNLNLNLV